MANPTGNRDRAYARAWTLRGTLRLAVLALTVALTLALAPTRASAAPDDPAAAPGIPQRYLDQDVTWAPCVFDSTIRRLAPAAPQTSCASVTVPMDWHHPSAHPDITIAIAYTPASGASRGLLTAVPGGPTSADRSFPAALGVENPQLFTDYDLLGVDPRGFGASEQLQCRTTDGRLTRLSTLDPTDRSARGQASREAAARLIARTCGADELAGFVSSRQMAHDLAFVRVLLGYDRLSVLGYGSGARVAATYAAVYPDGTDRLVLDSVPADLSTALAAPADGGRSDGGRSDGGTGGAGRPDDDPAGDGATPGGVSAASAAAAQRRLTELYGWLNDHDSADWGATLAEAAQRYAALRAGLDGAPTWLSGWQLDLALRMSLTDDDTIDQAAALLSAAAALAAHGQDGVSTDQATVLQGWRTRLLSNPTVRLAWAAQFARTQPKDEPVALRPWPDVVRCNDLGSGVAAEQVWRTTRKVAKAAPFVGSLAGVDACTYWDPVARDTSAAPDLTDLPAGLVVQSGLDPFGDSSAALRLHAASPATVLVDVAGSGRHGVALSGRSSCVDSIVDTYLFDLPAGPLPDGLAAAGLHDTACAARPLPGDTAGPAAPRLPGVPTPAGPGPAAPVNPVLAGLWGQALALS